MEGEHPHPFDRFKRDWDDYEKQLNLSATSIQSSAAQGFDKLPEELLVKILSYVPHDDLRSVRLTNHRLNQISYTASLWKKV